MMLNKLILIAGFSIVFSSCSKNKEIICPSFSIENRNKWISDSTGCLNERLKLINKDIFKYESFINRDVSCIKSQLGNWNLYYKYGKIDCYCYFLTCKYVPVVKGAEIQSENSLPISKEIMLLKFEVVKNKVLSASIMQP
jgi:hypothetical protein